MNFEKTLRALLFYRTPPVTASRKRFYYGLVEPAGKKVIKCYKNVLKICCHLKKTSKIIKFGFSFLNVLV